MARTLSEQEEFWSGDFGNRYIERNRGDQRIGSNIALFSRILASVPTPLRTCIEYGANIGLNVRAMQSLFPQLQIDAVEINQRAAEELREVLPATSIHLSSLFDFAVPHTFDLVLVKGVLIHLEPDRIADAYVLLHKSLGRYLIIAEYYNPSPVEVTYRGHAAKLFKRDFAGEFLDRYTDTRLRDYGFVYHRDPQFPQDDVTWFLIEKIGTGG